MNKAEDFCGNERPARKVFCQLPKGHEGSCRAVIFWEDESRETKNELEQRLIEKDINNRMEEEVFDYTHR